LRPAWRLRLPTNLNVELEPFSLAAERRRGHERQKLLLREMNNRVKNLFALAGRVVTLSARTAGTPKELAFHKCAWRQLGVTRDLDAKADAGAVLVAIAGAAARDQLKVVTLTINNICNLRCPHCYRARDHLLVSGVDPVSEFLDDFMKDDQGRAPHE
jgi:hypothetical protein